MSRASRSGVFGVIICVGALACQGEDAADVVGDIRGETAAPGGYEDGRSIDVVPLEGELAQVTDPNDPAVRQMLTRDYLRTIYDPPPDLSRRSDSPPTPLAGESQQPPSPVPAGAERVRPGAAADTTPPADGRPEDGEPTDTSTAT